MGFSLLHRVVDGLVRRFHCSLQKMVTLIGMLLLVQSDQKPDVPSYRDLVDIHGARV
jgi:hypothetical protein